MRSGFVTLALFALLVGPQLAAACDGGGGMSPGARMLTSPGSYAYDVAIEAQLQQAYLQQLQLQAMAKAAKRERQAAVARERRAAMLERRERSRERLIAKLQQQE
jgi:hypothetical protein